MVVGDVKTRPLVDAYTGPIGYGHEDFARHDELEPDEVRRPIPVSYQIGGVLQDAGLVALHTAMTEHSHVLSVAELGPMTFGLSELEAAIRPAQTSVAEHRSERRISKLFRSAVRLGRITLLGVLGYRRYPLSESDRQADLETT